MKNERLLAYALIAVGGVTLLSRLGGADWLWVGLVALVFLAGYVSRNNYGFLVAGSILAGVAVGLVFSTQAGMLLSLAVGFLVIDRLEPRPNRWPLYVAGILAVLGVLSALSMAGLLGSVVFALLLIAAGAYLLLRERRRPADFTSPWASNSSWGNSSRGKSSWDDAAPAPPSDSVAASPVAPPPAQSAPQSPTTVSGGANAGVQAGAEAGTDAGVTTGTGDGGARDDGGTRVVEAPQRPASGPKETASETKETASGLSAEAQARYLCLEAWRRETASAEGTPAYIVFRNETLERLAQSNPQTLQEVGEVKGIGPVKLERYGEAVLRLLRGGVR